MPSHYALIRRYLETLDRRRQFVAGRASLIEASPTPSGALHFLLQERAALKWALGVLTALFPERTPMARPVVSDPDESAVIMHGAIDTPLNVIGPFESHEAALAYGRKVFTKDENQNWWTMDLKQPDPKIVQQLGLDR